MITMVFIWQLLLSSIAKAERGISKAFPIFNSLLIHDLGRCDYRYASYAKCACATLFPLLLARSKSRHSGVWHEPVDWGYCDATRATIKNYVGRLDAHDSNHLLQNYNSGRAVTYFVHFPVTSPLPKLTSLTVNGDTICYGPGDIASPNSYVTTLSLQHTSYLQSSGGSYNNFQHQPQTRPQVTSHTHSGTQPAVIVNIGDDDATAAIYTVNKVDPTWTTDNSPYYVVNRTNQKTQPTHQYQPPTQQIFQARPTYEYVEPGYQVPGRRPVRPGYPDPELTRPAYEPEPETKPTQHNVNPKPEPALVTASPNRISSFEDPAVECGVVYGGNNRIPLIYNGDTYERGELPWLVAIYKTDQATLRFICGGTLVSDRHVVTAAHCMLLRSSLASIKDIVVKVGVHNLNDWSDDITVTRALKAANLHEEYKPATLQNDILILTLDKSVTFNEYIRPACLWSGNTDLSVIVGRSATVAGWGDQGVGGVGKQGEPHKVNIPIVSTNDCRASKSLFHELTFDTTLCAGDRKGSGPCVGDSGGGLYLFEDGKWRVRGVVSVSLRADNGDPTCNLNEYVVFTDTAQFLPWIKGIMAQNQ